MKRSEILCNESSHATCVSCWNTFVITNEKYGIVLYDSFWIQRCWQLYSIAVQILTRDFLFFHDCQFIEFVSDYCRWSFSSHILDKRNSIGDYRHRVISKRDQTYMKMVFFKCVADLSNICFFRRCGLHSNRISACCSKLSLPRYFFFLLCCGWSNDRSCLTSELTSNARCYDSLDPRLNILETFFSMRFVSPSYWIRIIVNVKAYSWGSRGQE